MTAPEGTPAGPPPHRPPWWPEGEPFPPKRWAGHWGGRRHGRARFARGVGCLFVLFATAVVATGVVVLWLIATLIGVAVTDGVLGHFARAAGIVVLVVLFLMLVAGLQFGRRLVGPVQELVDAAGRIEAGDFGVRVRQPFRAPRDLRALTAAFNTMAARLEAEEATRRRLLADLGHELRTPIAVIEGHLEAILDGVYPADAAHLDPILDETRVLERLVDDLRTVSLAEAGSLTLHREPVDVGHLVAEAATAVAPASTLDRHIERDVDPGLPELELDPVRIRQVLGNLLDNALRYTPPGGTVHLTARRAGVAGTSSAAVELAVSDEGPGLAPDVRETLFDRFVKSTDSPGSGLGLAIARAIVEAHGGLIRAEAASPHGTRIVVSLPLGGPGSGG
jgi:two-component system, OmpR family, sensor histidine kinase BaeS